MKPLLAAGVSRQGIDDALHVALLFNLIARVADALDWAIPSEAEHDKGADVLLKRGYKF